MTALTFELEHLDDATRDSVVMSGLQFMRSITDAYGAEKGMLVWDKINETMGNDIKGAIFFRLMTGDGECNVTVPATNVRHTSGNFIEYIKTVRTFTGWGLKEAKDFCDQTEAGTTSKMSVPFKKKQEFLSALRKLGVTAV